jgi:hypothetical protein
MLVHTRTTQRYVSEDGNLHNYRYENLKPYIINVAVAFKD